jgi:hypothetical protein
MPRREYGLSLCTVPTSRPFACRLELGLVALLWIYAYEITLQVH